MNSRNLFRVAAGLLIAGAVAHVVTLWPRVSGLALALPARAWLVVAGFALSAITALAACGLAALLLAKAADRPDARALTLFLAFLAVFWGSIFRFIEIESGGESFSINVTYGSGWISQSATASFLLAAAGFLRFSTLFPTPLTPDRLPPSRGPRILRRLREATLQPAFVWGSCIVLWLTQRFVPRLAAVVFGTASASVGLGGQPGASAPQTGVASLAFVVTVVAVAVMFLLYALGSIALGTRNLMDSYRVSSPSERSRILWLVTGFSVSGWMLLGAFGLVLLIMLTGLDADVLGAAIPLALVFAPLVVVVCAAVGILYSGAIDPSLALRRSTLYGALGVLGVIAFAAIENALSALVEQRLDLPGFVGSMMAGILVTVALVPVRGGIRRVVARRGAPAGASPVERQGGGSS